MRKIETLKATTSSASRPSSKRKFVRARPSCGSFSTSAVMTTTRRTTAMIPMNRNGSVAISPREMTTQAPRQRLGRSRLLGHGRQL
jgi:hypothetical protein